MSQAHVITVWTSKGGGGKTSLSLLLGTELALRGMKVLAIDIDHTNTGLSDYVMTDEEQVSELNRVYSSARLFAEPEHGINHLTRSFDLRFEACEDDGRTLRYPVKVIRSVAHERAWQDGVGLLQIIPAHISLGQVLNTLRNQIVLGDWEAIDPRDRLQVALESARGLYDVILIDPSPSLPEEDVSLANALNASDAVLVPLMFHRPSISASMRNIAILTRLSQERLRAGRAPLEVLGIAVLKYRPERRTHRDLLVKFAESHTLAPLLFNTPIPADDETMDDASIANTPPQLFAPTSEVARSTRFITEEVLARGHFKT